MNFTPELSAFQGAILSADNVHQFSGLTSRGGNEDSIEYVIESLSSFLEQSHYIIDGKISRSGVSQIRKFALFIVLNADLPELQQLVELENISTLIWTIPTIPKCLMCEIMWNLHMEKFISEIISYSNPQLALEVANAFLDHFKYFDPLECLDKLQLLSSACYILLCRLHLFDYESSEMEAKSKAAFNNFQQCMKYYRTPPNEHKITALKKAEIYKYQGKSIYSLLQIVDESLSRFTSKLESNLVSSQFYHFTYAEEKIKKEIPTFNICDSTSNILLESLNNANTMMLDTCKVHVMDVSIDVFCCWSEFEDKGKTMQQIVGELCFKVHNKLLNLTSLNDHPVVPMLVQISRKPIEMKEKINATEDADIIQNINNNNEESQAWIKALIHKEKLCQNMELLNIVHSNLYLFNEEDSYQLYTTLKQSSTLELDNKDFVEVLSVKVFAKCELSKKHEILENHFSNKMFVDMKETPEFKNELTSVFNKFTATPGDLTDILTVFLQNPKQVLLKIFTVASESSQQRTIMLKVMKSLKSFSEHYYSTEKESCIIHLIQKMFEILDTETKEDNFIEFISYLKELGVVPGARLLLLIIMTNVHKALLDKDINKLYVQLKVLRESYTPEELIQYRAPMMVMLGQVLNVARWQINTYCPIAPTALNIALDLQEDLIESYDGIVPINECQWLKNKLRHLHPLNMYYYRELWNPPGSNYLEIVCGITNIQEMNLTNLSSCLSQILCSCTIKEWNDVWESLRVFDNYTILDIIHATVALLTTTEKANSTDESRACILYCYRSFAYVVRYRFIIEPLTDEQVDTIVGKAARIAEVVSDRNIEEFGSILMPIFAYLTEKQRDYDISLADCLNRHLTPTKLSPLIRRVFLNGTT